MARFDDVNWLVRAVFRAFSGDAEQVTTLHYINEDAVVGEEATRQALANRLRDDCLGPFAALFSTAWTIDPVVVTDEVDPLNPTDPREQVSAGPGASGTQSPSTSPLPLAMCTIAKLLTSNIGRSFRGRIFVPGLISETDFVNGAIPNGSTYGLAVQAFLDSIPLEPDIVTGSGTRTAWVVYSRTRRSRSQSPYWSSISDVSWSTRPHWLRSRDDA